MKEKWELDAASAYEYHAVKARRGREFILRLTTGADVWLAVQRFAIENGIEFAQIHTAFMGGLEPAKFLVWAPDTKNPSNWHNESPMTIDNLSMILSMQGIIHTRVKDGNKEPFPAIHFVTGGAWNVPTIGGHLLEGSIVKGACEFFVTELLGLRALSSHPDAGNLYATEFPENWYAEAS
jgi:predicted DNA-binding protein with PD1-like motif